MVSSRRIEDVEHGCRGGYPAQEDEEINGMIDEDGDMN